MMSNCSKNISDLFIERTAWRDEFFPLHIWRWLVRSTQSQLGAFFHRRKCQRSLFLDLSVDYSVFPSKWCTPLVPCFLFILVSMIYFRHTLLLLSLIFVFAQRFIPPLFFWNSKYWWAIFMCKSVRECFAFLQQQIWNELDYAVVCFLD